MEVNACVQHEYLQQQGLTEEQSTANRCSTAAISLTECYRRQMLSSAIKQKIGDSTRVTERYCPAVANTCPLCETCNKIGGNINFAQLQHASSSQLENCF